MARQLESLIGVKFSDLSYDDKLELLQTIRRSRQTPKKTSKVVRTAKRAQKKTEDKLDALFASMTETEKKAFLEGLGK